MKRKFFQKCTVCLLMAMLFVFTLSAAKTAIERIVEKLNPIASPYTETVNLDWAKLYPFKNQSPHARQEEPEVPARQGIYAKIMGYLKGRVAYHSKKVFFYEKFIEAASAAENFFALPNANYIILDGDYMEYRHSEKIDIRQHAESLMAFHYFLQKRNIALLYVQLPGKILSRNMYNENADNFLHAIKHDGVPYLDIRLEIRKQGLVHRDLFFKTDHHWKPETGLWAAGVVAEYLNSRFDFSIDTSLYDLKRYNTKVYTDFLGSLGRDATAWVAKPEPISFLFPKFSTNLTLKIPSQNINKRGDFSIMYHQEYMEYILQKNIYMRDYYGAYCYGNNPLVSVCNNLKRRGKILIMQDSFSRTLTPFLALGIRDTEVMDLRHFSGSVRTFVEESSPDAVLVLYNPLMLNDVKHFDFK